MTVIITLHFDAFGWNIRTHMITGAIAYRLLEGTEPGKAAAIDAIAFLNTSRTGITPLQDTGDEHINIEA